MTLGGRTGQSFPPVERSHLEVNATKPKAVVSWSTGKDSAWALRETVRRGEIDVVGLLATVTKRFERVSMHGVRAELLERQASAVGLPLRKVEIPSPCPNEVYDQEMANAVAAMEAEGVSRLVFGDLFLRDIRAYREARLASTRIRPTFPLWGRHTSELAQEMVRDGIEAHVVCLDPRKLPKEFAGRSFDRRFLDDLPPSVDPCGENGEFHTFVSFGPMFSHRIPVARGATVERDGFVFSDLTAA